MTPNTHAASMPAPGVVWGSYPERRGSMSPRLPQRRSARAYEDLVGAASRAACAWEGLGEVALIERLANLRARLRREGLASDAVADALGCTVVHMQRALGIRLYESQLFAAGVLLDGAAAEMATGEGKTYAAAAAAAVAALGGVPVHIVTANDYLVGRDAAALRPFYEALGLSVGAVEARHSAAERRLAHACDVVYCTGRELAFDYLRDLEILGTQRSDLVLRANALARPAREKPLLRGLCMAIVDEADSVLLDDATVPLILSQPAETSNHRAFLWQALTIARELGGGDDFRIERQNMRVSLSETGRARLDQLAGELTGAWRSRERREEAISTALAALHVYRSGHDYLVREGRIVIIDKVTGRTAEGRVWSRGLHGLIELKEGCRVTPEMRTVGQITYQRFFRRYLRLCGMSGTLREARQELRKTYGLEVVAVPLRRPSRRITLAPQLFANDASRRSAIAERVAALHAAGRPVLIGTDSVTASEALGEELTRRGIPHALLNARQDRSEAEIIARAGGTGAVTVSTNMAGRGTDIQLGAGVAKRGGLHVICCQHNHARRLDRQLQGRCARQGDPGSVETWLALGTGLFPAIALAASDKKLPLRVPPALVRCTAVFLQRIEEWRQAAQRRQLVAQDREWERRSTFAPRRD